MTHPCTGQARHRKTSRLEGRDRENRSRQEMGTVRSRHNLLSLLRVGAAQIKPPPFGTLPISRNEMEIFTHPALDTDTHS